MKRKITPLRAFEKNINKLIEQHKLHVNDFEEFKKDLAKHPDSGDLIAGTGGVRKTRLKSASKGKRGGFRICYLDEPLHEEIFLILIYPKNVQEDLTPQKKIFDK